MTFQTPIKTVDTSYERSRTTTKFKIGLVSSIVLALVVSVKTVAYPTPSIVIPLELPVIASIPVEDLNLIDSDELDCLAANLFYESRNQPKLGQLAVGLTTVVRSRNEKRWGDTVCDVVHEKAQFSWVGNLHEQNEAFTPNNQAYLNSIELASSILAGEYDQVLELFNPTHFHTRGVNPDWNRNMAKLATINDHIFYE